jgi:hypothetical protein
MPYVTAGEAFERDNDARNHSRIRAHGVFAAAFRGRGRNGWAGEADRSFVLELVGIEGAVVE